MLDFGRVLRLIHANVRKSRLKRIQYVRILAQQAPGIAELVVVIHPLVVDEQPVIRRIDRFKRGLAVQLDLFAFRFGRHVVFRITDLQQHGLHDVFGRKLAGLLPVDIGYNLRLCVGRNQGKGCAVVTRFIFADDLGAHAVDGAEFQLIGQAVSENGNKALPHILRGRNRVGHGQDALRVDSAAVYHIPDAGNQGCGFAAAGNCQQQDRPVNGAYGPLLLPVQPESVFAF